MSDVPKRIEIPQFPGGKRIAFTTSWDDGRVYDRWVVKAFNAWGIKGTFNLNSGLLRRTGQPSPDESDGGYLDACEVADLFAGHEVAIHTVTHPSLAVLSPADIAAEVLEDQKALEDLVGYPVRGMAYPFGTYNQRCIELLRSLGIVYARTVINTMPCFPPHEPLAWHPTMHHFTENPVLPQRFAEYYDNPWNNGVFFVWGHSFEFAQVDDAHTLDALFQPVAGKSDVWYCTNTALFDYEAARQRLVIAANKRTAYNPSALSVTINVDGKLVDVPGGETLTLSTTLPG